MQASIYDNKILINKGDIHITKIQSQICTFNNYTINEIFEEINKLKNDKFAFIKEENILQIEFILLNRKRYLNID